MKTITFDYAESLGDTILEKYESLYVMMSEFSGKNHLRYVIGSPETTSIIETSSNAFNSESMNANVSAAQSDIATLFGPEYYLQYTGAQISVGGGKVMIFKTTECPKDEMYLIGSRDCAIIKFKNYIW